MEKHLECVHLLDPFLRMGSSIFHNVTWISYWSLASTMSTSWVAQGQSDGESDKGAKIVKYTEAAMQAITEENMKVLQDIIQKLAANSMTSEEKGDTLKELEDLFYGFGSQQICITMQALTLCFETTQQHFDITTKGCEPNLNADLESSELKLNQVVESPASSHVVESGELRLSQIAVSSELALHEVLEPREPPLCQSVESSEAWPLNQGEESSDPPLNAFVESSEPPLIQVVESDEAPLNEDVESCQPTWHQGVGSGETTLDLERNLSETTLASDIESSLSDNSNKASTDDLSSLPNTQSTTKISVDNGDDDKTYAELLPSDIAITKMQPSSKRKVVPKSEGAKERLRRILSTHFLLGDLDDALREQIVDAFQDLRVGPGTEVMKAGEVADFFYVIDVGEVDILMKKGNEPTALVHSKGAGETFGELALMYDTVRNVTVRTKTHCLLWSVDRPTFKSTINHHLSGSQIAQVLRELPALKTMPTRDIVKLSTHCSVQHFSRGQPILRADSHVDTVFVIQEGQVRMSWGLPKPSGVGDIVAMMNRLEVLGEALLLNDDTLNPWNYVASSDNVELIAMNRSLFDSDILKSLRKGLQIQLIILALQRVPMFVELDGEQLSNLAEKFTESAHKRGEEITRMGDALGSDARLYVIQKGTIVVNKLNSAPEAIKINVSSESIAPVISNNASHASSWGIRLGSFLKSSSGQTSGAAAPGALSTSPSPGSGPALPKDPKLTQNGMDNSTVESTSRSPSLTSGQSWSITTYAVFGEECLQDDRSSSPTCQATTVADSAAGAICLSVSLAEMTSVLGPIQEFLARVANISVLRKVPCLEYLTSQEMDMLSHSMGLRKVKAGEVIYRPEDPGDRLYIVHKGTIVESTKSSKDGKMEEQILAAGSFFGEEALLTADPRTKTTIGGETASILARTELYYLDRGVLEANLGPLQELYETCKANAEKNGIVKKISFEELEVIGLLGTGLFGKVKLVYSRRMDEFYALKCVKKAQVVKMQEEEHLRNEKMNMAELDHPFITKLVRTFKDEKHIYLLQQLTIGRELFQFMEKVGQLQEWEAAFYAGGVLLALEYMHGKGIVYRDLKPENTLIGENGYPTLIDMGFAKRIYNRKTFSMCGTPDYMAPEIIKRQGHGKAVDFWALGCLIFEMITNTSPFNRGSDPPQVVFQNITEGRFRCPAYLSPTAVDIITKLLDPNPNTRLGCRSRGVAELKEHRFFTGEIDFQLLLRQKEEAPMIPPKVTDYKALCIPDKVPDDEYENMNIVSQHDIHWDDIF